MFTEGESRIDWGWGRGVPSFGSNNREGMTYSEGQPTYDLRGRGGVYTNNTLIQQKINDQLNILIIY